MYTSVFKFKVLEYLRCRLHSIGNRSVDRKTRCRTFKGNFAFIHWSSDLSIFEENHLSIGQGEDTRTAEQGHPQKQFQKAMNCVSGIIVLAPDGSVSDPPADDIKDALHWFDMARLNGHRLATFYYATFLHRGIATQMDRAKAARIVYDILGSLKKEAEKKMTEAEFILGYCYLWGMCVKPNKMKAFDLFTNASARGDKNAQFYAGLFDFDELLSEQPKNWTTRFSKRKVSSVGEDHRSAFERLTQSNFALGELALSEIENNHDFALRGLSKVDATDPVAICLAGVCYYHGIGVPADKDKAIQFWKRSAKYGYWRAQWGLLKYQECVAGEVIISQEEAKKWQSEYSKMGKNFRRLHLVGVQ